MITAPSPLPIVLLYDTPQLQKTQTLEKKFSEIVPAQAGIDPYTIQMLMAHKTFLTTQRYTHHYSESLKIRIKALEASRAV
jgi:integrase